MEDRRLPVSSFIPCFVVRLYFYAEKTIKDPRKKLCQIARLAILKSFDRKRTTINKFFTCCVIKSIASQQQKLDQVTRYVPSGNIKPPGKMGQGETFVDWANVSHPVARVNDDTSQKSLCVQREDSLQKHKPNQDNKDLYDEN